MDHTLIVGGGIIGLLSARELSQAGSRVTLIDMGETGRESSWAGGGILSPLYPWRSPASITGLAHWSQARYPALTTALLDETGVDPEFTVSGLLTLDTEDAQQALDWAGREGSRIDLIDGTPLHESEPALGLRPNRALRMPDIAQVRPPRLARAVRQSLESKVAFREREEVLEILIEDGRAIGLRTASGRILADRILVCAGAWTSRLLERLGCQPAIEPVRGQMILFLGEPGQIRHITLWRDRYLIPRRDGHLLFGSTLEHEGFSKRTTAEAKEALHRAATDLFPILKRTPIEDHWAGLRPGSPNGIPFIGSCPGIQGLFLNAGHYRNGLVTAPASARLAADLMLGRPPILDPAPYALDAPR